MAEKKKRFPFFKRKGEKTEQVNIDEEALRAFEAELHAEMEEEGMEEVLEGELEPIPDTEDDEQENLDELKMEVERSRELHPESKPDSQSKSEPDSQSKSEPKSQQESQSESEPESESEFEPEPESESETESQSKSQPEAKSDSLGEMVEAVDTEDSQAWDDSADPQGEDEAVLDPEPEGFDKGDLRENAWQESLKISSPLEDSLQEQLNELEQIRSGVPEDRKVWIHQEAVRKTNQDSGSVHYRRRRRQPPKASPKKWLWIVVLAFFTVAWFFRASILEVLPNFEGAQAIEVVDPESQLRDRVDLFFSTAKVIEAESMTSFFSMTTMDTPESYENNREAINALIDLKTSFELVQELQYLGIAKVQMEMMDDVPIRAQVSILMNSVEPVLKAAVSETTWIFNQGQWILDADQYLADLKAAQIALDQVPVLPPEDNSDLPVGEVVVEEPEAEAVPEAPMADAPSATAITDDGFIQAGGFTYESETPQAFTLLTLKFGIQREGFEKMVFTSKEAKADQSIDAPSFEMWISEDNRRMTVSIDGDLSDLEVSDYTRFSALIKNIEEDPAESTLVFTFKKAVQIRPYEWKGLLIMDYEEKE